MTVTFPANSSKVARIRNPPFDPVVGLAEEDQEHGYKHVDCDVPPDQGDQAVDFENLRTGVKVDFFDFAVGANHDGRASEKIRERSIGLQHPTLNLGMLER